MIVCTKLALRIICRYFLLLNITSTVFECLLIYSNNNISRSTWVYEITKASIQVIKCKLKKNYDLNILNKLFLL